MSTEKKSTKERILDAALTLFSERGYDGVGVDLLAETIGLKGPSLYRHFKGKEEILNALIDRLEVYYEEQFGMTEDMEELPSSLEEMEERSMEKILFLMQDPMGKKIRKLLAIEQFRNTRLMEMTTRYHLAGLEDYFTVVLGHMIEKGLLIEEDPRLLSFEFVSPISLMIQLSDRSEELEDAVRNRIQMHLDYFVHAYRADNEPEE